MPPELKGLQHVGLKVRDIETSVRFCTDILGFRTNERIRYATPRGQRTAQNFMTCTGLHHVINLAMNVPEAQPDPQPPVVDSRSSVEYGLAHFAFEVEDKATFDAWEKHLRENGVELTHGPVVHSPTHPDGDGLWGENRALYFCDPDGNNIEYSAVWPLSARTGCSTANSTPPASGAMDTIRKKWRCRSCRGMRAEI